MKDLSAGILLDCSLIPSNTVFVHRESVYQTRQYSKSEVWLFSAEKGSNYRDGQSMSKKDHAYINENSISVHCIEGNQGYEHNLSEYNSRNCYVLDVSNLKDFMLIADKLAQSHYFDSQGKRQKQSPLSQHINLFPKANVDVENAWSQFNNAPWGKCWDFIDVLFSFCDPSNLLGNTYAVDD